MKNKPTIITPFFPQKRNKYNNKKTVIDGIKFDSKKEGEYYLYLKSEMKKGKILYFEMQKKYTLIPKQIDKETGKTIERKMTYKADFTVFYKNKNPEIIDVKGFKTEVYKIKNYRKNSF